MLLRRQKREQGAALIEFALVLPLLLAIAVGIIYYGYAFVLKTTVEHAAKNGAQAAVAVSPLAPDYDDDEDGFRGVAEKAAMDTLGSLANDATINAFKGGEEEDAPCDGAYGVTVELALASLLPQFSLGRFRIPPLGNKSMITSTACVTL